MLHFLSRGISIKNNRILLAHHLEKGYWFLPGGHIELGEAGAAALEREYKEEMGITVDAGGLVTVFEHTYSDKDELQHELTLIYLVDVDVDILTSQVPHLEFAWISLSDFKKIKFLPKALHEPIERSFGKDSIPVFISTLR